MAEINPGPQKSPLTQGKTPPHSEEGKDVPPFRTMRSDIERLFAKRAEKPGPVHIEAAPQVSAAYRTPSFIWKKILIGFFVVFFAAVILAAMIYIKPISLFNRPVTEDVEAPPPPPLPLTIPAPFFAVENSRSTEIAADNRSGFRSILFDSASEIERAGTIKRLIIKVRGENAERVMTLADLFNYLLVEPPGQFLSRTGQVPTMFIYYGGSGPRPGFVIDARDSARVFRDMITWEPRIPQEFRLFFLDATTTPYTTTFEDRTYRNIDWRYLKFLGTEDRGIGYAIFPAHNFLIVATSKESFEAVIDRLLSQ